MSRLTGRQPIEVNISSPKQDYVPYFNETTRLWETKPVNELATGSTVTISGDTNDGILTLNGSSPNITVEDNLRFDGSTLNLTGSMRIKGDLLVEGTTTLVQTTDENIESLIVSGAMSIVRNELTPQIVSASLSIQNLGTLADRSSNEIIDCGDGFF
jgi:hypothetical protein